MSQHECTTKCSFPGPNCPGLEANSINGKLFRKHEDARKLVVAHRAQLIELATQGRSAQDIAASALRLAEAEGERDLWYRVLSVAKHAKLSSKEMNKELALEVAFNMLANGADDTWSGRGNDARRAYFDGVREAATKVGWLF